MPEFPRERYKNHNLVCNLLLKKAMQIDSHEALRLKAKRQSAGLTIVESAIAIGVIGLVASSAMTALTSLNRYAASARIMSNAREIVQRNMETAMGVPCTSSSVPNILSFATNQVWDDDGGGDNLETIYISRDGSSTVTGTMLRTVQAETNAAGADIRRVTFRLNYTVNGHALFYQMQTIRAMDQL